MLLLLDGYELTLKHFTSLMERTNMTVDWFSGGHRYPDKVDRLWKRQRLVERFRDANEAFHRSKRFCLGDRQNGLLKDYNSCFRISRSSAESLYFSPNSRSS